MRSKSWVIPVASTLLGLLLACSGGTKKGPESAVTVTLGAAASPAFVACQDGDGPWKALSGRGGTYSFTVADTSGRYGVAVGEVDTSSNAPNYSVRVWHATLRERSTITTVAPMPPSGTVAVQGSVTGLNSGEWVNVAMRYAAAPASADTPTFLLPIEKGTHDLVVQGTRGLVLRRNIPAQADTTLPVVDMAAEIFSLEKKTIPINGLNGEEGVVWAAYLSANRSWANMGSGAPAAGVFEGDILPAFRRASGDLYGIWAHVSTGGDTMRQGRWGMKFMDPSGPLALDLPPSMPAPVVAYAANPSRFRLQGQGVSGASLSTLWATQAKGGGYLEWEVEMTPGWMGGLSTLDYTTPDLAGVQGFDSGWGFSATQPTQWEWGVLRTNSGGPGAWDAANGPRNGDHAERNYALGTLGSAGGAAPRRERTPFEVPRNMLKGFLPPVPPGRP